MAAESKDQRRSRLNKEGKTLLANNQEHMLTDQHRTAMEYFKRKQSKQNSLRAQQTLVDAGSGGKSIRATGTGGPKKVAGYATSQTPAERDKAFTKLSAGIKDLTEFAPDKAALLPEKRKNSSGAINEDDTHHAMMGSIADHLSGKLEEAEDKGLLHSKDTVHIDNTLGQAYSSLYKSNVKHNAGQVNDAKVHMESVAQNLHSAATQMASKGLEIHPKIMDAIRQTSQGYVRSTTPGTGAMPHPTFKPPVARSTTVTRAAVDRPGSSSDYSRLGKQFEEHQDVHETGYSGNDVTASEANAKFFREQMGY